MDHSLTQPEPWERQPGEPNRWYARFERYRLAGPSRSLLGILNAERQLCEAKKGKSLPQAWARNAQRWRWRERAEAWDAHERRQARAAHAQQTAEMNNRHIQEAKALQAKAIQRVKSLDADDLSPTDVLRFCTESAKLERTAVGEPETMEGQSVTAATAGAVVFTLEDAVRADQELENWNHDRMQSQPSTPLPNGDSQVP
jgi:hypothetical protein